MPKKKSSGSPAINSTNSTTALALSNMYVELETLEKEHQTLLKQIKRKRTEVTNFIEKMRSLGTEIFHRVSPNFQKIAEIDEEIHSLFKSIFENKKLGKRTRINIEKVYLNLQLTGIISRKYLQERKNQVSEENSDADSPEDNTEREDYNQQQEWKSSPQIKTEDSRRIRQTFLKLAEVFHPDKTIDAEIQMHHTEVMKEINQAYQEGDLARLLEIERQHNLGELIDRNSEDELVRRCKIIKQQNEILKDQYEKLKQELRRAKKSPEGQMLADSRKSAKVGLDSIDLMLKSMEYQINVISEIRNFVHDFQQDKISMQEFMDGPLNLESIREKTMTEILEEVLGL
jgi:translation elongation factor EF-G